jgi:cyclin-dependent kinase regulatory subunit CKS1
MSSSNSHYNSQNHSQGHLSDHSPNEWTESEECKKAEKEKCSRIEYSERYRDDLNVYEYRHVILPSSVYILIPKGRLMTEKEWRSLGIQQSLGWEHYSEYKSKPHILLFRRPINMDS